MAYSAQPGQLLIASKGFYRNQSSTGAFYLNRIYRWQRNGLDIPGAVGAFYSPTTADVGSTITVIETTWHVVEPNTGSPGPWSITDPLEVVSSPIEIVAASDPLQGVGLINASNITYVGSFALPAASKISQDRNWQYGLDYLGVVPAQYAASGKKSLILSGHRTAGVPTGQVEIPTDAQLKNAFNVPYTQLAIGIFTNPNDYARPIYGGRDAGRGDIRGDGPVMFNTTTGNSGRALHHIPGTDKCIINSVSTYGWSTGVFYRRPLDMSAGTENLIEGPFIPIQTGVQENARMHTGYMCNVPAEHQAAIGGNVLTGITGLSTVASSSSGPSAFTFNTNNIDSTLAKQARGYIQSAGINKFTLDSNASSVNDFYKGFYFYVPGFNDNPTQIKAYNGATKEVSFDGSVGSGIAFVFNSNPVKITTDTPYGSPFINKSKVFITGVGGTIEINNNYFYLKDLDPTGYAYRQYELYYDIDLTQPVDGTGYGVYLPNTGYLTGTAPEGALYKIYPTLEGTMLLGYYPGDLAAEKAGEVGNAFTWTDGVKGIFFPSGTKSIIFLGSGGAGTWIYNGNGEITGPDGYNGDYMFDGPKVYDPQISARGPHAFPYYGKVWAYNVDDFVKVKNGQLAFNKVSPYGMWTMPFPYSTNLTGVGYDDEAKRIYITQSNELIGYPNGVVHIYQVNTDSQAVANVTVPGVSIEIAPVVNGVTGSFIPLSSFKVMKSWVDGSYTQDFWRSETQIDDLVLVVSKEKNTNRVECWMYRPPASAQRTSFTGWGSGPDLSSQIANDKTYDVRISVNGSLITPQYSNGTTTRVICAPGTIRRLVSAFKPWDWTRVDSAISSLKVMGYNADKVDLVTDAPTITIDGLVSATTFDHSSLGGTSSATWIDGNRSSQTGNYISSSAVNHAWEARAISDRKNNVASNLTVIESALRRAAEYSGTFPQFVFLEPTTLRPNDPQKGSAMWSNVGSSPLTASAADVRLGSYWIPPRPNYTWDASRMYNNGHIAFEATRDPFYALIVQCNAFAALAQLGITAQSNTAKKINPTITATPAWDSTNNIVKQELSFYITDNLKWDSMAWAFKEYNKAKLVTEVSPAADFLQPLTVWNNLLANCANQLEVYFAEIDAVPLTTADPTLAVKAAQKALGNYEIAVAGGAATLQNPYAYYNSSSAGQNMVLSLAYVVGSGITSLTNALTKTVTTLVNRVRYLGGDKSVQNMGNGTSMILTPANSSGTATAPIPYTTLPLYNQYWTSNNAFYANLSSANFNLQTASSANPVPAQLLVSAIQYVHQLNNTGKLAISTADVSTAYNLITAQVASTTKFQGNGNVFSCFANSYQEITQPVSSAVATRPRAKTVTVSDVDQLVAAVNDANATGGNVRIQLNNGTYTVSNTLYINAPNVTIASVNDDPALVTIQGDAMSATARVGNVIRLGEANFELRSVTIQLCGWHAVQIGGESGKANTPLFYNCIFRNTYEQLMKISGDGADSGVYSDGGHVENCLFEYTAGIAPQYYVAGIDGHNCTNWLVRGNTFKDIASPSFMVAEQAVHFWGTANIITENNIFIDCDRAIQYGLGTARSVTGGRISNNYIYHSNNGDPFADVGISIESSPNIQILYNTVIQEHDYPNAIEYRFPTSINAVIRNNLVNKAIANRDNASATLSNNKTNATLDMFVSAKTGNPRLASAVTGVVDSGVAVPAVSTDIFGTARPQGSAPDIGAHEYVGSIITPPVVTPTVNALTTQSTKPVITGTAQSGNQVTVVVNGATYKVVASATNTWSVDTATLVPNSGTLGAFVAGQTYSTVATVTNSAGVSASGTGLVSITSSTVTPPPVSGTAPKIITPATLPSWKAYDNISYPIEASGALPFTWEIVGGQAPSPLTDNSQYADRIYWKGGGLPDGILFDKFNGQIVGASSSLPAVPATFTVKVSNEYGSDQRTFTLPLLDIDSGPPVIKINSLPKARIKYSWAQYSEITPTYIWASGATLNRTWSITSGSLPPGMTLDPQTGRISGEPTAIGNYTFTVLVQNNQGQDSKSFTLSVVDRSNTAPVIASRKIPDAVLGSYVTQHNTLAVHYPSDQAGNGIPISSVNWSIIGGTLPTGLSLNSSSGTITGAVSTSIPTGEYYFLVKAENAIGFDTAWINITITSVSSTAPVKIFSPTVSMWQGLRT